MYKFINGRKENGEGFYCSTATPPKYFNYCVAVKITETSVMVRDTKDASKMTLSFNHGEWQAFLKGVKDGEFDL